jgi:hypothetical protein
VTRPEPDREFAGYRQRGVLVLPGAHGHLLAVAHDAALGERVLLWRDGNRSGLPIVGTIRLSAAQREEWREQLERLLTGLSRVT